MKKFYQLELDVQKSAPPKKYEDITTPDLDFERSHEIQMMALTTRSEAEKVLASLPKDFPDHFSIVEHSHVSADLTHAEYLQSLIKKYGPDYDALSDFTKEELTTLSSLWLLTNNRRPLGQLHCTEIPVSILNTLLETLLVYRENKVSGFFPSHADNTNELRNMLKEIDLDDPYRKEIQEMIDLNEAYDFLTNHEDPTRDYIKEHALLGRWDE